VVKYPQLQHIYSLCLAVSDGWSAAAAVLAAAENTALGKG
jgi:hypothetical protein